MGLTGKAASLNPTKPLSIFELHSSTQKVHFCSTDSEIEQTNARSRYEKHEVFEEEWKSKRMLPKWPEPIHFALVCCHA